MFMIRRLAPIAAAALMSAALLAAQNTQATPPPPPPQDPQQPTFRTRVDTVLVDVSVTDKQGRPVVDLKPEDFEIREAGKAQTIDSFKLFIAEDPETSAPLATRNITSLQDQQSEGANPENRLIMIFLDDYHTRLGNSMQVRENLALWVRSLSPRDLVVVLYPLTPIAAATFSRNHDGTADAILKFTGRKYDYQPKNDYEQQYANAPPEVMEQMRNELTIRALTSACVFMGSMREGRKLILFVSEGMTATLPAGVRTAGSPIMQRPPTGTDPASTQAFFREADLMTRMRDIFGAATRNNTSIYTMDPRGLATSEFGVADAVSMEADRQVLQVAIDSLRTIADQTDGKAIVNRNDPLPELKKMVKELSSYYLLGYTSTVTTRDGKFHPIQVRGQAPERRRQGTQGLLGAHRGRGTRHVRRAQAGPGTEVANALEELAGVGGTIDSQGHQLSARLCQGERASVRASRSCGKSARRRRIPSTRSARLPLWSPPLWGMRSTRARCRRIPRPAKAGKVTFDAPPGMLKLRMVGRNARGQRVEQDDFTYDVADFTSARVQISTPLLIPRAHGSRHRPASRRRRGPAGIGPAVLANGTPADAVRRLRSCRQRSQSHAQAAQSRRRPDRAVSGSDARAVHEHVRIRNRARSVAARRVSLRDHSHHRRRHGQETRRSEDRRIADPC
jgi:VWFA-related protein